MRYSKEIKKLIWSRFLARTFDVVWETSLITLLFGVILGLLFPGFVGWINQPGHSQLFGILCLPFALCLDAMLYSVFRNTPGKALLGLKVITIEGMPLNLTQYLSRNFSMWASGLAFGIPLISLFTMADQSSRLGKGLPASYDESSGFLVHRSSPTLVKKLSFGVAFVGMYAVMVLLNNMEQLNLRVASQNNTEFTEHEDYSWENPLTRVSIQINSKWKNSTQTNKDGQKVYIFTEETDHAAIILGMEKVQGLHLTLDDYVRVFQKSTTLSMRFLDGGRFFERNEHQIWQGSGSLASDNTKRLNIEITQRGSVFWRIVTVQSEPYNSTDILLKQLRKDLWKTVK